MAIQVTVTLSIESEDLLLTAAYGAGAKVHLYSAATEAGVYTQVGTGTAIVSGTESYEIWDADGSSTTWYKSRVGNSGGTEFSEYSDPFQVGGETAYADLTRLKRRLNITDTADDLLLSEICDEINQLIESETKQPIRPIASATYLYHGNGLTRIYLPLPPAAATKGIGGLRAVTLVEFAPYTGGTFETFATTDWYLSERVTSGGPFKWLNIADRRSGTYTGGNYSVFPEGRNNIRVTGTAGWDSIPADLRKLALEVATRNWLARQVGYRGVQDDTGVPNASAYLSRLDRETLKLYTARQPF